VELTVTQGEHEDVKAMTFEAALAELEGIVGKLESGQAPLAESIAIYERGEALKTHCERLLKSAESRIEKITLSREGVPTGTEPLDS
jgi:exodeoxyribonuclease VII small subunit